jgi:pyruvate kinase
MIERLIKAGMDVARLNLAHGSLEQHARYIQDVRRLGQRFSRSVAILIDLPGPKYRTGKIKRRASRLEKRCSGHAHYSTG